MAALSVVALEVTWKKKRHKQLLKRHTNEKGKNKLICQQRANDSLGYGWVSMSVWLTESPPDRKLCKQ